MEEVRRDARQCVYSQHSEGSVMVWDCFHQRGWRLCQSIITEKYIYSYIVYILSTYPPYNNIWDIWWVMTFQHDNRPKHTANAVKAYLHRNTVYDELASLEAGPQHYWSSEVEQNQRPQTSKHVVWWDFRTSDSSEELPGSN